MDEFAAMGNIHTANQFRDVCQAYISVSEMHRPGLLYRFSDRFNCINPT